MAVPRLRFKADDGKDYPNWDDFAKLKDMSIFITKGATPTTYGFEWQSKGVYFFRNDCIKNNIFVYGDYSFISEEANKFLERSEVTGGDIVIAITGDIGKVGLIPNEVKKANINQHLARVRIVKGALPYFVYMYLCSNKVQRTYKKIKTGLSMAQLSLAQIRDTNIPIVSFPEQQKIAEFLSTIDTVIEKQKEIISAWEERKKGVMQKLFSQEVRFKADDGSEFPEWKKKRLGEICDPLTYGMNVAAMKFDGENKYIRITDIDDKSHLYKNDEPVSPDGELDNRYLVKENDILLARTGASVGKSYLYNKNDGKLYYAGFLIKAHIKCENSKFIFYQTLTDRYNKWVKVTSMRSGQPGINANEYSDFIVYIPCLTEQQKIADCLSTFDEVIEKQKATLAAWEELKKGLLQQMFV